MSYHSRYGSYGSGYVGGAGRYGGSGLMGKYGRGGCYGVMVVYALVLVMNPYPKFSAIDVASC